MRAGEEILGVGDDVTIVFCFRGLELIGHKIFMFNLDARLWADAQQKANPDMRYVVDRSCIWRPI